MGAGPARGLTVEKQDAAFSDMDRQELLEQYQAMCAQASRDSLTGLLNRGALEREVELRLKERTPGACCALFMIDMDNFKKVNDQLGHQAGDELILKAARQLSSFFRAADIVGRLGGDEFVVFLTGGITEALVRKKAQLICDNLQFWMGPRPQIFVTASVGIRFSRDPKVDFAHLYRSADAAMYRAKASGKQCYSLVTDAEALDRAVPAPRKPVNAVRLRPLLDSIDSGIALVDTGPDMAFLYVSPAFARLLGTQVEKIMSRSVLQAVHPDDRPGLAKLLREQAMDGTEPVNATVRVYAAAGKLLWCRVHAVRVEDDDQRPVTLLTILDVSELKESQDNAQLHQELMNMMITPATQAVWELELAGRTFHILGGGAQLVLLGQTVTFPQGLIDRGWLDPDSQESFLEFAQEILDGRRQGYGNFKFRRPDGQDSTWCSLSYRTVFDEKDRPVRVVGVLERMQGGVRGPVQRPKGVEMPECLMDSLEVHAFGNLSREVLHACWLDGTDVTGKPGRGHCTGLLVQEAARAVSPELGYQFRPLFSRNALLALYAEQKNCWIVREYQRIGADGNPHWVSCVINLYPDENGDVMLALWISRVEQRRYWESRYPLTCYRDPISRLYTRATVRDLATRLLEDSEAQLCGLVVIEVCGLARVFAQDKGRMAAKWNAIAAALTLAMGTDLIPGQFGTDRFVLFFPEVVSEDALKRRLEKAFLFLRSMISDLVDCSLIRMVAGGICRPCGGADYDVMVRRALRLCSHWGNASGDRIAFADDEPEESWEQLRQPGEGDRIRTVSEEFSRPLSDREQSVALSCFLRMFSAESLDDSVRSVLRSLGEHYEADRVYIVTASKHNTTLSMPYEWTSSQKHSIQKVVSGALSESVPLVAQCIRENRPVFLTRQTTADKAMPDERTWHFAVFPMRDADAVQGYLCIENARNHMADATLPLLLSSCLLKERRKILQYTQTDGTARPADGMELPHHGPYLEVIYSFTSDAYRSLGVVCVSIPNLPAVNATEGFAQGRRMMWDLVHTLSELFGRAMVFRTWDAEFIALAPNTAQEVFYGRCARLRAMLLRSYPGQMRIGSAWADESFTGRTLVERARTHSESAVSTDDRAATLPTPLRCYSTVREMICANCFCVYFQPQFSLETGALTGVEALVRGTGNPLMLPGRFLPGLEKLGGLRDLDLFVLDTTMRLMARWQEQGVELVPFTVNFSCATLRDARIPASILAIQSRYPEFPAGLVGLELAAAELRTVPTELLDTYRDLGLALVLDGYGASSDDLTILTRYRFDMVKFHRSIISELPASQNALGQLTLAGNTCRSQGHPCAAVGVETEVQLAQLRRAGCTHAQGHYYSRALSPEQLFQRYLSGGGEQELEQASS